MKTSLSVIALVVLSLYGGIQISCRTTQVFSFLETLALTFHFQSVCNSEKCPPPYEAVLFLCRDFTGLYQCYIWQQYYWTAFFNTQPFFKFLLILSALSHCHIIEPQELQIKAYLDVVFTH